MKQHIDIPEPPGFAYLPTVEQVQFLEKLRDRIAKQPREIPWLEGLGG